MRPILISASLCLATLSVSAAAQATRATGHDAVERPSSDEMLILNAMSAAPASLAARATIMGHDGRVLRKGTTDWVCLPDMPDVPNDTPMCLDAPWRAFIDAWMNKRAPAVTQVGFGYMLQGDLPVSNVDPFATEPTPANEWIAKGDPHVMVLLPDPKLLEGLSTDSKSGGPFVMWKGTPYAHIMLPAPRPPR